MINDNTYLKIIKPFLRESFLQKIISLFFYTSKNNNLEFIKKFTDDISQDLGKKTKEILIIEKLLTIDKSVINYDNALSYFSSSTQQVINILNQTIENYKYNSDKEFNNSLSEIHEEVNLYYNNRIRKNIFDKWDDLLSKSEETELGSEFKELIETAHSSFSKIDYNTNSIKEKSFLIFDDDETTNESNLNSISHFLNENYRFYKTGFPIIDNNIGGIETSTVNIVVAFTNNGKSLFMVNALRNMLLLNNFKEDEALLFITIEDNIQKLLKRLISIFGNYSPYVVKLLYFIISQNININQNIFNESNKILKKLLSEIRIEGKRFIFQHFNEGHFSMADAVNIIEEYKDKGIKITSLFLDYIDVMRPISKNFGDDYNIQGEIVHDMKFVAQKYAIPIFTATQGNKLAENKSLPLSFDMIGDSIKKTRYACNVLFIRKRNDLSVYSDTVRKFVMNDDRDSDILLDEDNNNLVTPMEISLLKAKEGDPGTTEYLLLCKHNLRIYSSFKDIIREIKETNSKTKRLESEVNKLKNYNNFLDDDIEKLSGIFN